MVSKKTKIVILKTDITQLSFDAIVNAANKSLLGGGGVDGAIHRAAGPELLAYCKTLGGAETGEAKISPAFHMKAKYIIHTVGPVWRGGKNGEEKLLRAAYQNSLLLADQNKLRSIAFPSISTGVYGYPFEKACIVSLNAISDTLKNLEFIEEIALVTYSENDFVQYKEIYNAFEKGQ